MVKKTAIKVLNEPLKKLLNKHKLELVSKIDGGSFGEVHKVRHNGKLKALKLMLRKTTDDKWAAKNEQTAKRFLKNSPNVCMTLLYAETPSRAFLVMRLCDSSLSMYCKRGAKRLTDDEISAIIRGVLKGLEYIHSKNLVHADIKPANILLIRLNPIIADFGLCKLLTSSKQEVESRRGTDGYKAYETAVSPGIICQKSDIFSFGVTIYELVQRCQYFTPSDKKHLDNAITWSTAHQQTNQITNESFKKLAQMMLQKCRSRRFTAKKCLAVFEKYESQRHRQIQNDCCKQLQLRDRTVHLC